MATIEFENVSAEHELLIYDMLGKVVRTVIVPGGTNKIIVEKGELAIGMYFYNLFDEARVVAKGKLIIE